ncbi:MAG: DoxX family membrane protein [Flavobacteriales bacterium]|nr:DoxX family membrane protein [Flavobacteriales bacterium]
MENLILHLPAAGILFLRLMLGMLFLFQGYEKVALIGTSKVAETFRYELKKSFLPDWLFSATALYSSWVELIGGALLILGLLKPLAFLFLGVDLILVTAAMGMMNPLWDLKHVFPRMILLVILMFIPIAQDVFSIDHLLNLW